MIYWMGQKERSGQNIENTAEKQQLGSDLGNLRPLSYGMIILKWII